MRWLVLLIMFALAGCTTIENPLVDESAEITAVVEHEGLTLELIFEGEVLGEDWDAALTGPYVDAAGRWLEVIDGIEGVEHHTIEIVIEVVPLDDGLGAAAPDTLVEINGNIFPTVGFIEIGEYTYSDEFAEEFGEDAEAEFNANILHEMGHVFGIGTLWNVSEEDGEYFDDFDDPNFREWAVESPENDGPIYTQIAGVDAYNAIFGTDFDFMPLLGPTMDHVFSLDDDNEPRSTSSGVEIPPAEEELMANGRILSSITAGLLDDLGYEVNYTAVDEYDY